MSHAGPFTVRCLLVAALVVALAAGCGQAPALPTPEPPVLPPSVPTPSESKPPPIAATRLPERDDPALAAILDAAATRYQGTLGAVVKNLRTGATARLNADRSFRAASLYKLFVLYVAFSDLERGWVSPDEELTFSPLAFAAEPNAEWRAGTRMTVDCALQAMTTRSNNTATAMLIERLGGEDRITAEIRDLGFQQTEIGVDHAYTTPEDVARLFEYISAKKAVTPAASDAMLGLLRGQVRNDRLPLPLPLGVEVAHKTGELQKLRHDAGIVYAPSGPYLFIALAADARSDAAARQAVLDLSRDVYAHFEPAGLTTYQGLPPRLAIEVFRLPDAEGRLTPLDDQWAQIVSVDSAGVALARGVTTAGLREMAVPDLLAMQLAAFHANAPFWVTGGFRAPLPTDAPKVLPVSKLPCRVEIPAAPTPTPGRPQVAPTPAPAPKAPPPPPASSQRWLGTLVAVSDSPRGEPTTADQRSSAVGRWIQSHAWEYGFVLAPVESTAGKSLGHEPWKLRWVGRTMAAHLHALRYERNPTAVVTAELEKAERELMAAARTQ